MIVYAFKKFKTSPEKMFSFFAIPLGASFAILMMINAVPDEGKHIMKAYDISVGHFVAQVDEKGNSSATVIEELEDTSHVKFLTYENVMKEIDKKTDYSKEKNAICGAQGNFPFLYVGTASILVIGRLLKINIFLVIYIGRIVNLIIFITFGYFAIKKIPFGKVLLAVYLCMPMMLQQAASFSADAVLNGIIVYYIVHLIYMIFKEEITRKDRVILYIFTALVGMSKFIYILIAGILFIKLFREKENRKRNLKTIAIMVLIGLIFTVLWFIISSRPKSIPDDVVRYNKEMNVNSRRASGLCKKSLF